MGASALRVERSGRVIAEQSDLSGRVRKIRLGTARRRLAAGKASRMRWGGGTDAERFGGVLTAVFTSL